MMTSRLSYFYLFLITLSMCTIAQAQTSVDEHFFSSISSDMKSHKSQIFKTNKDKNEIERTGNVLYGIYRNLISSQDGSTCRFHPTCSAYCRSSIHKNGIVFGMIKSMDRLTRCNGLSPEKYQVDIKRRKLVDYAQ